MHNGNMMILFCELAIKSEGTRFCLLWTTKLLSFSKKIFSLPNSLTFRAQIPSSGPLFSSVWISVNEMALQGGTGEYSFEIIML